MDRPIVKSVKRGGFTLTELLVVIGIVSILVAMGAGASYLFIARQRVTNTENAMRGIDKVMQAQWKKVVDEANKEQISPAVLALANGNNPRARVLWIKFRLTEAFPQSYAEVAKAMKGFSGPGTGGGIYGADTQGRPWLPVPKYMSQYYAKINAYNSASHDPLTESSACLFLALGINRGGVVLDEGNLTSFIMDTDSDGLKELVDNWGHALQFQRFPIGNPVLSNMNPRAGGAQAMFGDPLDPSGYLQQDNWYQSANASTFTALCNHPFPSGNPQPYWIPFTVSDGRDETPGTADDIFSYNLTVGASGN